MLKLVVNHAAPEPRSAPVNFFKTAEVIKAPEKKDPKSDKIEHAIKGLSDYAHVDAVIKNLTTLRETLGEDINTKMKKIFKTGEKRPDNFRGIDGTASASCEMRRRASSSPLTTEERAAFDAAEIPYETLDVVPQRYIVNPKWAGDEKLLEKISAALAKIPGMPDDFIQLQEGSKKYVVTEESINTVYEKKLTDRFFTMVSVLAIKAKLEKTDVKASIKVVKEIIDGQE